MKQKLITILSIICTIIILFCIVFFNCRTVAEEPIQKLLNQIEANEQELQNLETRKSELEQWIEDLKSQLNQYWLQLAESETETAWTSEVRTPWKLTEDWDHQEMPELQATESHERFKELATAYWLDASQIRAVENHYWIKEWVILCITVAETSWWNRWYGEKNIGSVGSNDRWDRPTYALMEAWLEWIGKTLTNKYLWWKQTLWCLSNAWSCKEPNDNWKRYATSESSREKNMVACLWTIYWPVNASEFSIRR